MPMLQLASSEHGAVEHVQRSQQRRGAVSNVIVRTPSDIDYRDAIAAIRAALLPVSLARR